jgi:hypothetical protein
MTKQELITKAIQANIALDFITTILGTISLACVLGSTVFVASNPNIANDVKMTYIATVGGLGTFISKELFTYKPDRLEDSDLDHLN